MTQLGRVLIIGAALLISLMGSSARSLARAEASGDARAERGSSDRSCFFRRNWDGGWKTTSDARTIYIRVSGAVYRLDLQASYPLLRDPWATLIDKGSTDSICSPLDFRFTVSNKVGGEEWPLVKHMTRLTPEEVARLPKQQRP